MKNAFNGNAGKQDIASRFSNQILAMLDSGVRPWAQPWQNADAGRTLRPLRANGTPYGGINTLMLWMSANAHGFTNPSWMTYRQAAALGGHVMKGEHGTPIVYASTVTKPEEKNGETVERKIPFMRAYKVFNVQQIGELPNRFYDPPADRLAPEERIANADEFFASTGADIHHGGNKAFYTLKDDYIRMPEFGAFKDPESYYACLSHEITHWTRHPSRLARDFGRQKFGDEGYAKEEIVAEIGSAILCSELDLTPQVSEENAAYIDHWRKFIRQDKNFIFKAAAHGQRAADFVISAHQPAMEQNIDPDYEVDEAPERQFPAPRTPMKPAV